VTRDNESEPNLCETITCNDISIFRRNQSGHQDNDNFGLGSRNDHTPRLHSFRSCTVKSGTSQLRYSPLMESSELSSYNINKIRSEQQPCRKDEQARALAAPPHSKSADRARNGREERYLWKPRRLLFP